MGQEQHPKTRVAPEGKSSTQGRSYRSEGSGGVFRHRLLIFIAWMYFTKNHRLRATVQVSDLRTCLGRVWERPSNVLNDILKQMF